MTAFPPDDAGNVRAEEISRHLLKNYPKRAFPAAVSARWKQVSRKGKKAIANGADELRESMYG